MKILAIGDETNNFYLMQKYAKNFEIHLIDFPKKGVDIKAHSSPSGEVELFDSLLISKQVDKIKQIKDKFDLCIAKPWAGARIAYLAGLNSILYFTGSDIITPPFIKNAKHPYSDDVTENLSSLERWFYRKVFDSAIACVSTTDEYFLPLQKYRKDAIRIDRICVDTELFNENVSEYNLEKKKFTFFAPQRLGLEKGYDLIWNAIKLCKSDFDFIQVKWFVESNRGGTAVTDTDKLSKITKDLYENAPPQVKFIPLIDHKDLGRYFAAADAIMGQMQTGVQGGIEREASFCKKPVLSYNDPNKKTILDGKKIESPFLPKSRDPNELAKLIDKIVESKAFQDDLATKQYEYIKNLSTPEFVMKDWERIFESLTKKYKTINRKIPFSEKIVNYFGLSFERFYIKKFREKNIQVRGEKEYELLTRK
jgi:glycosyltransferase involved in cell wall biosynthesis